MKRPDEAAKAVVPDDEIALLERILRGQLDDHKRMLDCIERNREAVRNADMEAIKLVCQDQNSLAQHLAELEKVRLTTVGRLTESLQPQAATPLSVSQIAEAVGEPAGPRLTALADQLRATVQEVRRASTVVRTAADALARHMSGLMQTVHSALTRARVYSRRGRLATGAQSRFSIDVTT
ncbi:MAG: flagellar export chaperone FlgN [Planctomycetota bacterium]|jgi:methyl-accepting chemotaxis protein